MPRLRPPPGLATGALVSAALHAGWLLSPAGAHARSHQEPPPPLEVVEFEPPPSPPPPPPPPPTAAEPAPAAPLAPAAAVARPVAAPREAHAPAPAPAPRAAAQAGRTLTAPEAAAPSPEVADFTMVQGSGDMYAGGTTASNGTSNAAVRGAAGGPGPRASAAAQAAPAPAPPPAPEGPDRSRAATPASGSWSCSHLFPSEADGVNTAAVSIAVTVRPDGSPQTVRVLSDPGHGFGAAARACALSQRYAAALDRAGQPVTGTTPPFTVRFTR